MKQAAYWIAAALLLAWLAYLLHQWTDCTARGGQWLRSPFSNYQCVGAR
jgi:hypothetical protein